MRRKCNSSLARRWNRILDDLLSHAAREDVVILAAGDPMVSTTHIDLRMRAAAAGIGTRIIHGASIQAPVCGLCGLQNYRFGKSCSLPFPSGNWFPTTPIDVITANLSLDLHTLVYLDIQDGRYMSVHEAIDLLGEDGRKDRMPDPPLYRDSTGRFRRAGCSGRDRRSSQGN